MDVGPQPWGVGNYCKRGQRVPRLSCTRVASSLARGTGVRALVVVEAVTHHVVL